MSTQGRPVQTADEIAADEAAFIAHMQKHVAVNPSVEKWRKAQAWSRSNRVSAKTLIPCAACGTGTLHLSMSSYNGHIAGLCTTVGCVRWME